MKEVGQLTSPCPSPPTANIRNGHPRFEEMVLGQTRTRTTWSTTRTTVRAQGEPNELRVAVIKARDLPVMDGAVFGSGSSDPWPRSPWGGDAEHEREEEDPEPVWRCCCSTRTTTTTWWTSCSRTGPRAVERLLDEVSVRVGSLRGDTSASGALSPSRAASRTSRAK